MRVPVCAGIVAGVVLWKKAKFGFGFGRSTPTK